MGDKDSSAGSWAMADMLFVDDKHKDSGEWQEILQEQKVKQPSAASALSARVIGSQRCRVQ